MKKIWIVLVAAAFAACGTGDKNGTGNGLTPELTRKSMKDTANYTTIQWLDSTTQNLGKAKEGQVVEVSFRFKNSGDKNLIIEDVRPSCGCTVPEKPERPFAPGEEGVIKAKFDSHNRAGVNAKEVFVTANTKPEQTHTLKFNIEVTTQ